MESERRVHSDFESLSRAVAALEKKARPGGRRGKKSGGITSFSPSDYGSIPFSDILARVSALESMLGKRTITKFETQREMASLQSRLRAGMQKKPQTPIKEPSQQNALDEIYSKLPKKMPAQESAPMPAFRPTIPASKARDDSAVIPEGMLGDVELARKEMKLSDAEQQIETLKNELEEMKRAKDATLGAESEKLKASLESERKKEMEEAQRKISLLTKSLEDDYERKLAREIAKIKAAKSDSDIARAQVAGATTLSQLESYISTNPPRKKGLAQAFTSLKNLIGQSAKSPGETGSAQAMQKGASPQAFQKHPARIPQKQPFLENANAAPDLPRRPYPPTPQSTKSQAEDIEKMREDFERKSREIRQLLKKKD